MEAVDLSWNQVLEQIKELGLKIKKDNFKPDILIGMIRGGLVPTRMLSKELGCNDIYCLRVRYVKKGKERTRNVRIIHGLNVDLTNNKVLIVDEIADSGETLRLVTDYIKFFNPSEIKTAVIHLKETSKFNPDYFLVKVNKWVNYPWD